MMISFVTRIVIFLETHTDMYEWIEVMSEICFKINERSVGGVRMGSVALSW